MRRLTVVVEVDAVASVWVNVGLKLAGVGECCPDSSGNASSSTASGEAITSAIDRVLAARQDESRTGERRGGRSTIAKSEDFSKSNRLLGALSKDSGANIEVARIQEGEDVACQIAPGEISGRQVLCNRGDSSIPAVDDITNFSGSDFLPDIRAREVDTNSAKSRLKYRDDALTEPGGVSLGARDGLIAEAERLIETSEVQVPISKGLSQPGSIHREASESDTVRGTGVESCQKVTLERAERVSD